MRRVVVAGPGGAGKSTLAQVLGARLGLPVVHLDRHFWKPGWAPTPEPQWRRIQERLFAGDRWVADGNYSATIDVRLRRADTVVLVDLHPLRCAVRAVRRTVGNRGRAVQAEGCPERLDREFLAWILDYRRRSRPKVLAAVAAHAPHAVLVVGRRPRDVRRFVAGLVPERPRPEESW